MMILTTLQEYLGLGAVLTSAILATFFWFKVIVEDNVLLGLFMIINTWILVILFMDALRTCVIIA